MNNTKKILLALSTTSLISASLMAQVVNNSPKVVYGNDDRHAATIADGNLLLKMSNSTAAMISWSKMKISGDKVDMSHNPTLAEDDYFNICPTERFANEVNPANCSGFLIGDDILVTAGHCIRSQSDCDNNAWVFDFTDSNKKLSKSKSVYKCQKILASVQNSYSDKNDFSVLKLDRSTGRDFLEMRSEGAVSNSADLFVVGHPSGLPQKIAGGATVRSNITDKYFKANLDTFGGNSGSPVIDVKSGKIEGILVRGERDYVYDSAQGCNVVYQCEDDGCRGEDVTRITNVSSELENILNGTFQSNLSEDKIDDFDFVNNYFFGMTEHELEAIIDDVATKI